MARRSRSQIATAEAIAREGQRRGYSNTALAGIIGNIAGESGGSPTAYNSVGGGYGAYGLAQWRGPRLEALARKAGVSLPAKGSKRAPAAIPVDVQVRHLFDELDTTHKKAKNSLVNAKTVAEATRAFMRDFEAPSAHHQVTSFPARNRGGQWAYSALQGGKGFGAASGNVSLPKEGPIPAARPGTVAGSGLDQVGQLIQELSGIYTNDPRAQMPSLNQLAPSQGQILSPHLAPALEAINAIAPGLAPQSVAPSKREETGVDARPKGAPQEAGVAQQAMQALASLVAPAAAAATMSQPAAAAPGLMAMDGVFGPSPAAVSPQAPAASVAPMGVDYDEMGMPVQGTDRKISVNPNLPNGLPGIGPVPANRPAYTPAQVTAAPATPVNAGLPSLSGATVSRAAYETQYGQPQQGPMPAAPAAPVSSVMPDLSVLSVSQAPYATQYAQPQQGPMPAPAAVAAPAPAAQAAPAMASPIPGQAMAPSVEATLGSLWSTEVAPGVSAPLTAPTAALARAEALGRMAPSFASLTQPMGVAPQSMFAAPAAPAAVASPFTPTPVQTVSVTPQGIFPAAPPDPLNQFPAAPTAGQPFGTSGSEKKSGGLFGGMSTGAVVGAALGGLFAGPIGAVAGGWLGDKVFSGGMGGFGGGGGFGFGNGGGASGGGWLGGLLNPGGTMSAGGLYAAQNGTYYSSGRGGYSGSGGGGGSISPEAQAAVDAGKGGLY